jgi:hypothetical protein
MLRRTNIQSILIIGLLAVIALPVTAKVSDSDQVSSQEQVTDQEDDPPGSFSVGPWEGRCIRDGWLNGAKNESCGAGTSGPGLQVFLSRTVKDLTVTLSNDACKKPLFKATISKAVLAAPNRAVRLEVIIQGLVKKQAKKCGSKSTLLAPITTDDLTDILTETDGLEF